MALGVFATDTNGLQSETLNFNLVVQDINQAPTIDSVALSPVTENSVGATVGTVQASDPDADDTLSYSVSDNRFEFDGNTLKLAADTSLDFEQASSVDMVVTVTDQQGASDSLDVTVVVEDLNDEAPVAIDHAASGKHQETITTLSNNEPSVLFGLTDADEGPDTHTVEVIETPSVGSLVLNSDGTFEYTPSDEQIEVGYQDTFTYQIADSADNLSNIATVTLNVEALLAPEAQEQMADLQSTELAPFSAVISETLFSSPEDATPLSYSVVAQSGELPAWLSFDGPTRTLAGTPQDADTGTVALSVFATDTNGLQSDTLNFNLVVQDINQAPTIDSVALSPVTENSVEATVGTVQAPTPTLTTP